MMTNGAGVELERFLGGGNVREAGNRHHLVPEEVRVQHRLKTIQNIINHSATHRDHPAGTERVRVRRGKDHNRAVALREHV